MSDERAEIRADLAAAKEEFYKADRKRNRALDLLEEAKAEFAEAEAELAGAEVRLDHALARFRRGC